MRVEPRQRVIACVSLSNLRSLSRGDVTGCSPKGGDQHPNFRARPRIIRAMPTTDRYRTLSNRAGPPGVRSYVSAANPIEMRPSWRTESRGKIMARKRVRTARQFPPQARFLVSVRGGGRGEFTCALYVCAPFSFITNRVPDSLSTLAGET